MNNLWFKKEQLGTKVFHGTVEECYNYKKRMRSYNENNPNFYGFVEVNGVDVYLYDVYYSQLDYIGCA